MSELHVVALSGGKDSTGMAVRLAETNPQQDYTYVCTPTGRELPEMFEHWQAVGRLLGKPILPIIGGDLFTLIREQGCIPNFRQRFCTRIPARYSESSDAVALVRDGRECSDPWSEQ